MAELLGIATSCFQIVDFFAEKLQGLISDFCDVPLEILALSHELDILKFEVADGKSPVQGWRKVQAQLVQTEKEFDKFMETFTQCRRRSDLTPFLESQKTLNSANSTAEKIHSRIREVRQTVKSIIEPVPPVPDMVFEAPSMVQEAPSLLDTLQPESSLECNGQQLASSEMSFEKLIFLGEKSDYDWNHNANLSQLFQVPSKSAIDSQTCEPSWMRSTSVWPICEVPCSCRCHRRRHRQSPSKLGNVAGSLVVGYPERSILGKPKCNVTTCKATRANSTANATYYFPRWFVAKAASLTFRRRGGPMGIVTTLTFRNVRERNDEVFCAARGTSIRDLQRVFRENKGRPTDVDQDGKSVLYHAVASQYASTRVIRFLLDSCGADPYYADDTDISPYDRAWVSIFKSGATRGTQGAAFSTIFPNSEPLSSWSLTTLHKVVLGLKALPLSTALADPLIAKDINAQDIHGRTPLWWSIDQLRPTTPDGDVEDMSVEGSNPILLRNAKLLLDAGADPNLPDNKGDPPLRQALLEPSLNIPMLNLLVSYGASLTYRNNNNMSPLHVAAAYFNSIELLELLASAPDWRRNLDFGGGWQKRTPLQMAIRKENTQTALWLIEQGANVEVEDDEGGSTPLQKAVLVEDAEVMEALLEKGADARKRQRSTRLTVLQLAACRPNIRVMNLLAARRVARGIDLANRGADDRTCNVFEILAKSWFPSDDISENEPESWGKGWGRDVFWRLLNTRTCERCAIDAARGEPAPAGLSKVGLQWGHGWAGRSEQVETGREYWEQEGEQRRWQAWLERCKEEGLMKEKKGRLEDEKSGWGWELMNAESDVESDDDDVGDLYSACINTNVDPFLSVGETLFRRTKPKKREGRVVEREKRLPPHGLHVEDDKSLRHLWWNVGVPKPFPGQNTSHYSDLGSEKSQGVIEGVVEVRDDDLAPLLDEKASLRERGY
ncbi:MAG: hypothetical protein M1820_010160 [Bogoriella megaspora]|nr:MAG: hypothetical protein M1820_010160 [Bogoriella megaspora]